MTTQSAGNSNRLEQLDSLRGIAALTVVIFHAMNVFIPTWGAIHDGPWYTLIQSPLRILWSGHQAVMMFFLLSGFVLALPFLNHKHVSYPDFIKKRICRIYIPYLIALMVAVVMRTLFYQSHTAGLWDQQITWELLRGHLLLVDTFNQNLLDPVVWSLVHEMRISLIFPLLMLCVKRYHWKQCLLVGLLLSCSGISLHYAYEHQIDKWTNYFDTMQYIFIFMAGALLAANRDKLSVLYQRAGRTAKAALFVTGFLLYTYSNLLDGKSVFQFMLDWVCTAGGAILLVMVLNEPWLKNLLTKRPLTYLGKISYSLYLYHLIVFLTLVSVLGGLMPGRSIALMSIAAAFCVAHFAYERVEVPSMRLGKRLTANGRRKLLYEQTYSMHQNHSRSS